LGVLASGIINGQVFECPNRQDLQALKSHPQE
jgi:hypothetical protein